MTYEDFLEIQRPCIKCWCGSLISNELQPKLLNCYDHIYDLKRILKYN